MRFLICIMVALFPRGLDVRLAPIAIHVVIVETSRSFLTVDMTVRLVWMAVSASAAIVDQTLRLPGRGIRLCKLDFSRFWVTSFDCVIRRNFGLFWQARDASTLGARSQARDIRSGCLRFSLGSNLLGLRRGCRNDSARSIRTRCRSIRTESALASISPLRLTHF